jgi:hypothetical protein
MYLRSITLSLGAVLLLVGCSGKQSLLTPGQVEGDCDAKAAGLGVCGTPKSIYEHRDKIKHIYFEEDEAYRVSKNGKIYNTETGEEVIPGKKPDGCGLAVCPGCEEDEAFMNEDGGLATGDNKRSYNYRRAGMSDDIRLSNRSLIVETPQKQSVIRDLGMVQKIWIAPHEDRSGDLISAHEVFVVIKKPSWIVGEKTPKNVKRGVVVPSPVAISLFSDNHQAVERKNLKKIFDYKKEEPDELKKIQEYITSQKNKNGGK